MSFVWFSSLYSRRNFTSGHGPPSANTVKTPVGLMKWSTDGAFSVTYTNCYSHGRLVLIMK